MSASGPRVRHVFNPEIPALTGLIRAETGESGKGARFAIVVPEGAIRVADKEPEP